MKDILERQAIDTVTIDGFVQEPRSGERLIDVINRSGAKVPQVCYHAQLPATQPGYAATQTRDLPIFSRSSRLCVHWPGRGRLTSPEADLPMDLQCSRVLTVQDSVTRPRFRRSTVN